MSPLAGVPVIHVPGPWFNPYAYGSPLHAFWADDPAWSNPGDGGGVTSWRNQSGGGNLAATDVTYLDLPGTSGNYASAPDSAPLSITSDIDIRVKVAMDDWTPATVSNLIGKWVPTGNQRSYAFYVATNGTLHWQFSNLGTASTSDVASTVATGVADGAAKWVRVTWRQSDGRTQFFTSDDGSSWTQLGTDVTASTLAIFNSTAALEIGAQAGGTVQPAAGNFRRVQIRSNVLDNGTGIVFDSNFEAVTIVGTRNPTTLTESSSNAATVTMNGSAWDWGRTAPTFDAVNPAYNNRATIHAALGQLLTVDITNISTFPFKVVMVGDIGGAGGTAERLVGYGIGVNGGIGDSGANVWAFNSGSAAATATASDGNPHVFRVTQGSAANAQFWLDEVSILSGTATGTSAVAWLSAFAGTDGSGLNPGNFVTGDLAFLGIYPGSESDATLAALALALRAYYGTP